MYPREDFIVTSFMAWLLCVMPCFRNKKKPVMYPIIIVLGTRKHYFSISANLMQKLPIAVNRNCTIFIVLNSIWEKENQAYNTYLFPPFVVATKNHLNINLYHVRYSYKLIHISLSYSLCCAYNCMSTISEPEHWEKLHLPLISFIFCQYDLENQ